MTGSLNFYPNPVVYPQFPNGLDVVKYFVPTVLTMKPVSSIAAAVQGDQVFFIHTVGPLSPSALPSALWTLAKVYFSFGTRVSQLHTCGTEDGSVSGMGYNSAGELGLGDFRPRTFPPFACAKGAVADL